MVRERSAIAAETGAAVRAAKDTGMSVTRIAEVAGVSRQTVHDMLRE